MYLDVELMYLEVDLNASIASGWLSIVRKRQHDVFLITKQKQICKRWAQLVLIGINISRCLNMLSLVLFAGMTLNIALSFRSGR